MSGWTMELEYIGAIGYGTNSDMEIMAHRGSLEDECCNLGHSIPLLISQALNAK